MRKKMFLLAALLTCTFYSHAQSLNQYIGKSRLYQLPTYDNEVYAANLTPSSYESVYGERITANKIVVPNGSMINEYSSSHGDYVEFQYSYKALTTIYVSTKHMMFTTLGHGFCALAWSDNTLCLVRLRDDSVIMILDNNFIPADDFSVMVKYDGNRAEPSFWYINNGILKVFSNISTYSAVSPIKTDTPSKKTYTLGGVETSNPSNGIYVQNGEKVIIK